MYGYDASTLYGVSPLGPTPGPISRPTEHMGLGAGDIAGGWRALVDPRNPLVWFGAILAVTLGAAGVSGSARVGPVRASGSVGDSK